MHFLITCKIGRTLLSKCWHRNCPSLISCLLSSSYNKYCLNFFLPSLSGWLVLNCYAMKLHDQLLLLRAAPLKLLVWDRIQVARTSQQILTSFPAVTHIWLNNFCAFRYLDTLASIELLLLQMNAPSTPLQCSLQLGVPGWGFNNANEIYCCFRISYFL